MRRPPASLPAAPAGPVARVAVPALGRGGDRILDYRVPPELAPGVRLGSVVRVPLREREARGVVVALAPTVSEGVDPARVRALRAVEGDAVPEELLALARWLAEDALAPLAAAAAVALPPPGGEGRDSIRWAWRGEPSPRAGAAERRIAALLGEGARTRRELLAAGASPSALARLRRQGRVVAAEAPPPPPSALAAPAPPAVPLTPDQRLAAARAAAAIGRGGAFLLMGPTGSGKTEVYLEVIAQALTAGRGAILLVPEIALTPQAVDRFRRRFGDAAAVLHSAMSDPERAAAWRRLAQGRARVAIGPRSAVWAPVADLGAIIVDEEPEASYRGERVPRYDARRVAAERTARAGAALVLGSATPSLEALAAVDRGELALLRLEARAAGRPMPAVEVVDLRRERRRPGGRGGLVGAALAEGLRAAVARGEQAVLLLNRRGYHPVVVCRDCGYALRCPDCDVSLTLHADRGLVCHYCGRAGAVPALCPRCGGVHLGGLGAGTQRLVEEVGRLVPGARILRLDRDSARRRGEAERLVTAFGRGEGDILVGTQMVAKGHDLPNVTLVGVVLADQGLRYPDVRAAERTAQLLVQAAGRAGRGERPGRVILQTYDPDHAAVRAAAAHDYLAFAREEMARRRELGYPPYGAFALATVAGAREERVEAAASAVAEAGLEVQGGRVLGPAPPPVPRVGGLYLRQVLVRVDDGAAARAAARRLMAVQVAPGVRLDVTVDPA
ncbi:MAG: primosomal protein N' [Firmicutes bacterium]|nr:primosomal protein N' [Bacillota bacterium]